ncbi:hypothetical protein RS85_00861 [Microbacterium sp. SA39]|nr:hypothetical protein RS85_00861 [Microbacterium sp. SA39]
MDEADPSLAHPAASKQCGSCRCVKPLSDFNRKTSRPDGRQEVCRECNRLSSRDYYARNREHHIAVIRERPNAQKQASIAFIRDFLLRHPCVDCSESDLRVLDFDHRPGSGKRDDVMRLVRNGFSIAHVTDEVAKCDVRCRNCQAIATYERMGANWRSLVMSSGEMDV